MLGNPDTRSFDGNLVSRPRGCSLWSAKSNPADGLLTSQECYDPESQFLRRDQTRRYAYSPNTPDYNIYAPLTSSRRDQSTRKQRNDRMCKSIEIDPVSFQGTQRSNIVSGERSRHARGLTSGILRDTHLDETQTKLYFKDSDPAWTPQPAKQAFIESNRLIVDSNGSFGEHLKSTNPRTPVDAPQRNQQLGSGTFLGGRTHEQVPSLSSLPSIQAEYNLVGNYKPSTSFAGNMAGGIVITPTGSSTLSAANRFEFKTPETSKYLYSDAAKRPEISPRVVFSMQNTNPVALVASSNPNREATDSFTSPRLNTTPSLAATALVDHSQAFTEIAREVSGLKDKFGEVTAQNQKLKELNKLLLSKLMHLHRAVSLASR